MAALFNGNQESPRHHHRTPTIPFARSSRHKPRRYAFPSSMYGSSADMSCRWPLALRFVKGAIHSAIILPVALHAIFASLIVYIDQNLNGNLGLPASIVGHCGAQSEYEDYGTDFGSQRSPACRSLSVSCLYNSPHVITHQFSITHIT